MTKVTAWWFASLVTATNVLVASGFSIAGLISPASILPVGYVPTNASLIFAMYAAGRSLPLAVIVLIAIYLRSVPALLVLGALAGFVQFLDAAVGIFQGDLGKSIGPLTIAIAQFFAIYMLKLSTEKPPKPSGHKS